MIFRRYFYIIGVILLCSCSHAPKAAATLENQSPAQGAVSECSDLAESISQMIEAQDLIQKSLIDNHQVMADNMSDFADTLKASSGRGYKEVSQSLYKASESVQKRKEKAKEISKKFSEKSDEVLKMVKKCLK